jgi:hypothetical protein
LGISPVAPVRLSFHFVPTSSVVQSALPMLLADVDDTSLEK